MTEPSRGPYEIDTDRSIIVRTSGGTSALAQVYSWMGPEEADANARLFATSLDMLAACRAVIAAHEAGMTAVQAHEAIAMCKAAVAKADGA